MMRPSFIVLLLISLTILKTVMVCNGDKLLKMKYYQKSCRSVDRIVSDITWRKAAENPRLAAKLLRLQYHDCFVRVYIYSFIIFPFIFTIVNLHSYIYLFILNHLFYSLIFFLPLYFFA